MTTCVALGLVLLLRAVSDAAGIWWTDAGADHLWSNPANWDLNRVPTLADEVTIDVPAAAAPNGPVIQDGIDAKAYGIRTEVAGVPTLTMTGGSLEVADWIWWGDGPGSYAEWTMTGGIIEVGDVFELGWGAGAGTLQMYGGTVTATRAKIPTATGEYGHLYLHGGTYNVTGVGELEVNANGLIDIRGGTMVLEGNDTAQVQTYIDQGRIAAFGGTDSVVYDYNVTNPGKTTVRATSAAVVLTWDGLGDANWGAMYDPPPEPPYSHWLDGGLPTTAYPDDEPPGVVADVVINADVVTVAEDRTATSLTVNRDGGDPDPVGVVIAGHASPHAAATLTVEESANFGPGTSLTMGRNATLHVESGSIDAITTSGNATINVGSELSVTSLTDGDAGTFTKEGAGKLTLDNSSGSGVSAANTVFRIAEGELEAIGPDPLGGASDVLLAGGMLTVSQDDVLDILFVVLHDSLLVGGDQGVYDSLTNDLKHNVTPVSDFLAQPALAEGKDLVIISATARDVLVGTKFTDADPTFGPMAIPTIEYDSGLAEEFGFSDGQHSVQNADTIRIREPSHPLAAGLSGNVQVRTTTTWSFNAIENHPGNTIAPGGTIVADDPLLADPEHPLIFVVDRGNLLANGLTTSANRIHFYLDQEGFADATDEGRALFEAAVDYAVGGGEGPGPFDISTTNLAVTASSTLNCDSPFDALLGNVSLDAGVTLVLAGNAPSVGLYDFNAGDGSTLDVSAIDEVLFRGAVRPGGSVGTCTVRGFARMDEGAECVVELEGAQNDLLIVQYGDIELAGTLTIQATGRLDAVGVQTRRIIEVAGEDAIHGEFTTLPDVGTAPPDWTPGAYLGAGVWFGDDRTGQHIVYVDRGSQPFNPDRALAVDITVFQAQEGDTDGNRDVSFADFNDLANNYTGSLAPGTGGKDWPQGDFDLDQDVDFNDFNELANNYTGTGIYYTKKAATGGRALGNDVSAASFDGADPELIVNLGDGSVVMIGGPVELNGYSVTSAANALLPHEFPMPLPLQFYLSNNADEITTGVLGTQVVLDGSLEMAWGVDVRGLKSEPDLVFSYGTSAGTFHGNVVYVVPEPGILALLASGLLGLLLWRRRAA